MRRIIFVLADGLRPDAVSPALMPSLLALAETYTHATRARTVRPSATVAALASLATGVSPETHRLIEPGLSFLPRLRTVRPVARELSKAGISTAIATSELAPGALPVAWALAATAGVRRIVPAGKRARETAASALQIYGERQEGLLFVYLPDCDRIGHQAGWMSKPYLDAAAEVDIAIGMLASRCDDALFIVTADHGGGGVLPTDHDEPHPLNDAIPVVIAGHGAARRQRLRHEVSILDLPATILWWLGCEVPASYEGQPLALAFDPARAPALASVPA